MNDERYYGLDYEGLDFEIAVLVCPRKITIDPYDSNPDEYEPKAIYKNWTYYITKQQVIDSLYTKMSEDSRYKEMDEEDMLFNYIEDNVDSLFEDYYDYLLDYFKDEARKDAEENYESPYEEPYED